MREVLEGKGGSQIMKTKTRVRMMTITNGTEKKLGGIRREGCLVRDVEAVGGEGLGEDLREVLVEEAEAAIAVG